MCGHNARNLGFIFDEHLSFSDQITALSKSCNFHIRQLRCIRPFLDIKTASIIATSIVHSKLDYCNSLYYNLPNSQLSRLQHIQNSLACAVVKTPKFSHITPTLKSLHWLKVFFVVVKIILTSLYLVECLAWWDWPFTWWTDQLLSFSAWHCWLCYLTHKNRPRYDL